MIATPATDIFAQCGSATLLTGSETGDNTGLPTEPISCGSGDLQTVWYQVDANGADYFDLEISQGSIGDFFYAVYTGCVSGELSSDCGISSLNIPICFPDQSASVWIVVGSEPADEGDFDITVTPDNYPFDVCESANPIQPIECNMSSPDLDGQGPDACPDAGLSCGDASQPGSWYTFEIRGNLTEISTVGSDYELFEGTCGSLTSLGCTDDIYPVDNTQRYYIWVSGSVVVNGQTTPPNDDCANAIDASSGSVSDQTNVCSTDDGTTCEDFSVWYTYTVNAPVGSLTISVQPGSLGGYGIMLYENDCSSNPIERNCNSADLETGCLAPGTYLISVSSVDAETGTFDLTVTENAPSNPNNDCTTPALITVSGPCVPETISGTTVGACPEAEDYGTGCEFDLNPTVWFEYTPSPAAVSVDFLNISSSTEIAIFSDCTTSFTPCISSDSNETLSGGTTYLIAVTVTTGEDDFSFDIIENEPPANNDCGNAEPLSSGSLQNTCCASDGNGCGSAGVWFVYDDTSADGVEFSLSSSTGNPLGWEIYENDCAGPLLTDDCGPGPFSFDTKVCGNIFYIHVMSEPGDCGRMVEKYVRVVVRRTHVKETVQTMAFGSR